MCLQYAQKSDNQLLSSLHIRAAYYALYLLDHLVSGKLQKEHIITFPEAIHVRIISMIPLD